MKAGIIIEEVDLDIFKKHLDEAGFEYIEAGGLPHEIMCLQVETESAAILQPVVVAAFVEAKKRGMH